MAGSNNFVLSVKANPDLKGNIRDYATINELICLSNMENQCRAYQRRCSSE